MFAKLLWLIWHILDVFRTWTNGTGKSGRTGRHGAKVWLAMTKDISALARSVLQLSRNTLVIHLRFMDTAISRLEWISLPEAIVAAPKLLPLLGTRVATEGTVLLYDPLEVCRAYAADKASGPRNYLHLLLHCIFRHFNVSPTVHQDLWNLACDMAVEGVINSLHIPAVEIAQASDQQEVLLKFANKLNNLLTAEKIYALLRTKPPAADEMAHLRKLFSPDDHRLWYAASLTQQLRMQGGASGQASSQQQRQSAADDHMENENTSSAATQQELLADWKEISEGIQMDLETFSKQRGDAAGNMMQNLRAVNREKYDYAAFLKKFAVMGEVMHINEDEFDYVFYTYGMKLFPEKRMPLIEPLEYKDVKRIREFVIAIDTSGSVRGEQVQAFLQKTYNILHSTESFFSRINVHIIQCDAAIQEDVKITSQEEFDHHLQKMQIKGLGGTDFRPVFQRVNEMLQAKEFVNLKGLIYFTDGHGVFPEQMPPYKTAFVFVEDGYELPEVPVWAMKLVLTKEEMKAMKT